MTKVGYSPVASFFPDDHCWHCWQAKAKIPTVYLICDRTQPIAEITACLDFSDTRDTFAAKDVFAVTPTFLG